MPRGAVRGSRETKLTVFLEDQSFSDLLYSPRKIYISGSGQLAGNIALLLSDVADFAVLPAQRLLAGNSFIVSCDLRLTNESARCCRKYPCYITKPLMCWSQEFQW